jgi:hypothetical protein
MKEARMSDDDARRIMNELYDLKDELRDVKRTLDEIRNYLYSNRR